MECLICEQDFMSMAMPLLIYLRNADPSLRRYIVTWVFQICSVPTPIRSHDWGTGRNRPAHFLCPTCASTPIFGDYCSKTLTTYKSEEEIPMPYSPKNGYLHPNTCYYCKVYRCCAHCSGLSYGGVCEVC